MAHNLNEETTLQTLPHDLLGEILSRVGASSTADFANAVITCKDVHASSADPKVYKSLYLSPLIKNPLIAYDNMTMFQQCMDNNNPQAHLVQGILSYFVVEYRVEGLEHLLAAADSGHTQSIYLYGILKLCISHFEDGNKILSKIKLSDGYKTMDHCWEELMSTLHGLPFTTRKIYHASLLDMEPPLSCHKNDMKNKCGLCMYYKQSRKFIFME